MILGGPGSTEHGACAASPPSTIYNQLTNLNIGVLDTGDKIVVMLQIYQLLLELISSCNFLYCTYTEVKPDRENY